MATKLKVCGVTRAEDILLCRDAGVDAIGLNFWSGSKRGLSPENAKALIDQLKDSQLESLQRIGVFVDADPSEMRDAVRLTKLDAIQPHGERPIDEFSGLGIPYVWVIRGTPGLSQLKIPNPLPEWILLDAAVAGFGGAGVQTDWDWAAKAVRHFSPMRVWLAGGITPQNAEQAIQKVSPFGLDVASGAELAEAGAGEKDPSKVRALARICAKT